MICEDLIAILIAFLIIALWSATLAFSASFLGKLVRFGGKVLIGVGIEKIVTGVLENTVKITQGEGKNETVIFP